MFRSISIKSTVNKIEINVASDIPEACHVFYSTAILDARRAFIPPIAAALLAFIISPGQAPIIAYISGTLGSLVGADLLNLDKIPDLRTPVASIGGAGTFDGIFLTGIISVLIA
jgi:uncharacterized membrane protein